MTFISKLGIPTIVALWLVATLAGFKYLHKYEDTPAASLPPVTDWPAGSTIVPDTQKPTFVIFLHPHCPCSSASVHSLFEIMKDRGTEAQYIAVFVRPKGVEPKWEESATYKKCRERSGLITLVDDKGAEAAKFGALTSGESYIYGPKLNLAFAGGITSARGMEEVGPERELVEKAIQGKATKPLRSPVFGCSLQ